MEHANESSELYASPLPYPPVCVERPNRTYALAMLDNIGGRSSEMNAVSLYFYNNLITHQYEKIALCFHKISIVEMHHLSLFGQLALKLGENPRLWTQEKNRKVFWNPSYNQYSVKLDDLLINAINSEKLTIKKYQRQAQHINDPNIIAILNRVILDEEKHIEIFNQLYQEYICI